MGHAGAIISGRTGTAESKLEAFKRAGVEVARKPSEIASRLKEALGSS
ncbi:MAG: succinate--CoA ligase subunit alpha, partial [Candidatus Bathyarchaeia archaeon]